MENIFLRRVHENRMDRTITVEATTGGDRLLEVRRACTANADVHTWKRQSVGARVHAYHAQIGVIGCRGIVYLNGLFF